MEPGSKEWMNARKSQKKKDNWTAIMVVVFIFILGMLAGIVGIYYAVVKDSTQEVVTQPVTPQPAPKERPSLFNR